MKLLVVIVLTFCFSNFIFAEHINIVTEENPPYNFTDNQKASGFSTDIVREVLKRSGHTGAINIVPWARAYKEAQEVPNTIIFSMARSKAREQNFKWVGVVGPFKMGLFTLAKKNYNWQNISEAVKYKTAAVYQDVSDTYLLNNGFQVGKNLERVPDQESLIKLLFAEKIEFAATTETLTKHICKKIGKNYSDLKISFPLAELSTDGLYMAFSKQTKDSIVDDFKKAYESMKKDGTLDKLLAHF